MIETIRSAEAGATPASVAAAATSAASSAATAVTSGAPAATRRTRELVVLGFLLAFAAGFVVGGGLRWIPWRDALRPLVGAITLNQK
jgi:ABC-type nitrate/sulfonate/bicarbonate transport system permease component